MTIKLDETTLTEALTAIPRWSRSDDGQSIERRYGFDDFAGAFALVSKIADLAEAAQHHPDIAFGWGRVEVTLTTHDAGGLSSKDVSLAKEIENAADRG